MSPPSVNVITAPLGLRVNGIKGRGLQIDDDPPLFLTTDPDIPKQLLDTQFIAAIGGLEAHRLLTAECILYSKFEFALVDHEQSIRCLNFWLATVKAYFQSLWFIKDNAVDCELAFLEWKHPNDGLTHSSNVWSSKATNSVSKHDVCVFSVEELKQARSIFKSHVKPAVFHDLEKMKQGIADSSLGLIVATKGVPRLVRANYFLGAARAAEDLGVKLALYISCLEILFSTDAAELTHKLSERVACSLGNDSSERKSLFQVMKRAYSVRSKVLHGNVLKPDAQQDLGLMSNRIDAILRSAFRTLLESSELSTLFKGSNDQIDAYFTDLLFGKGTKQPIYPCAGFWLASPIPTTAGQSRAR